MATEPVWTKTPEEVYAEVDSGNESRGAEMSEAAVLAREMIAWFLAAFTQLEEDIVSTIEVIDGGWVTATAYERNNLLTYDGVPYRATADHTSGASTEPGVGGSWQTVWEIFIASAVVDDVANSQLAAVPAYTFKGRESSGDGEPEDLAPETARTVLNIGELFLSQRIGVAGTPAAGTNAVQDVTYMDMRPIDLEGDVYLEEFGCMGTNGGGTVHLKAFGVTDDDGDNFGQDEADVTATIVDGVNVLRYPADFGLVRARKGMFAGFYAFATSGKIRRSVGTPPDDGYGFRGASGNVTAFFDSSSNTADRVEVYFKWATRVTKASVDADIATAEYKAPNLRTAYDFLDQSLRSYSGADKIPLIAVNGKEVLSVDAVTQELLFKGSPVSVAAGDDDYEPEALVGALVKKDRNMVQGYGQSNDIARDAL